MNKVAITTNSACIFAETAREYGITLIPFHIIIEGKDHLDPEVDMGKLYVRLDERKNLPTTSTLTVAEFLQTWQELASNAETILHISMTRAFTGAYNLALQAKEMARERLPKTSIEVIDSRTTGSGLALICIKAAEAARQGKNMKEVTELVNYLIPRVNQFSSRDTLFYLDKGGRVFEAKSWAEAELVSSFRAIIEIDDSSGGVTKPVARAKTRTEIMNKLVDITKERAEGKKLHVAILHTRSPEQAEKLKGLASSQLQCEEIHIGEGSATVAVFNGRGLIELSFYASEKDLTDSKELGVKE